MSMKRLFVALNSLLIAAVFTTVGSAQQGGGGFGQDGLRFGPSARPFGKPDSVFGDDLIKYDAQMWAPCDVTGVDGHTEASTGFYIAFDRAYASIDTGATGGSTFHWGNRYDVGFISDEGRGWNIQWLNLEGSTFLNGAIANNPNPGINTVNYNTVELNRVFRQELSSGGYLEPYVGLRYSSISDRFIQDTGTNRFAQTVDNSGVGGQIGARFVRAVGGRANFELDGNISAVYNNQEYEAVDAVGPANVFTTLNQFQISDNDFIPAMDLSANFQFRLSRDISLRAGGILNWQWAGVNRVNTAPAAANPFSIFGTGFPTSLVDDDTIAAGFTFGIDWRR